jgi:hypothetical protein
MPSLPLFYCPGCSRVRPIGQIGAQYLPNMAVYICMLCLSDCKVKPILVSQLDNVAQIPWSDDQVLSLTQYQKSEIFFPFICTEKDVLNATKVGLVCDRCGMSQSWAYDWTLNWHWRTLEPPNLNEPGGRPVKPPRPFPTKQSGIELPEPAHHGENDIPNEESN